MKDNQEEDLSLYDGELKYEDGYLVRRWIDELGHKREARTRYTTSPEPTGIEVDWKEDSKAFHREYYRKIRRHREGRKPRVPDDES